MRDVLIVVRKCIGFGEFEGKCQNPAGTKWSEYWCERCDKLRLEHIDEQLSKIHADFFKR